MSDRPCPHCEGRGTLPGPPPDYEWPEPDPEALALRNEVDRQVWQAERDQCVRALSKATPGGQAACRLEGDIRCCDRMLKWLAEGGDPETKPRWR